MRAKDQEQHQEPEDHDVAPATAEQRRRGHLHRRHRQAPGEGAGHRSHATDHRGGQRFQPDHRPHVEIDRAIIPGGEAASDATWYCDPLDGTTNFVHGHPFWSVSIGLLEAGVPTVGAVVAPVLGLWWTGYQGGPSLRCGVPCEPSATDRLAHALLATGFPVQRDQEPASNLSTFVDVMRQVQGVRGCGSAAVDLCLVADGTYDAFWERKLNGWDVCAGAAVLLGAGGRLSALDGSPADVRRGHIVASNGRIHAAVVDMLRKHS